jgi:hypothetical protein
MNYTPEKLRAQARRLDRVNGTVARVLTKLQRGQALHLEHSRRGSRWWTTDGHEVSQRVAELVILDPSIVSVDAALWRDLRPQTWRFAGFK